jgi:outer membrane protein assembly complex protein YaeT
MTLFLLFISVFTLSAATAFPRPFVRHVKVEGNIRVPTDAILQRISVIPDAPVESAKVQEDLKELFDWGCFEDIQVQSLEVGPEEVDIIYRVREHPFISSFNLEGIDAPLGDKIHAYLHEKNLELLPGTAFDPAKGKRAALAVRDFFRIRKYPNAQARVSTEAKGDAVRVELSVQMGRRLEIGAVRFTGNSSVSDSELIRQMRISRPAPFWARWGGAARYVPEELRSDLQRISFYYKSHGFAEVSIGRPSVRALAIDQGQKLEIEIPIVEGARFRLTSLGIEGTAKAASAEVRDLIAAIKTPSEYDYSILESTRQKIADALGHHGYALALVQMMQSLKETDRTAQVLYKIDPGDPIVVGKIVFRGNEHLPDKFLRRELRIGEGEVYDSAKLDQSVERLNKSNLVNEVRRADVNLEMNPNTNLLDIAFSVKEKNHQGIYFTGGAGESGVGYLGLIYTAFNFLRLGETISLELDGGAAQSNLLLNMVGARFGGSPFTLALSIFNRATGYNVANIVPDTADLASLFHRRKIGAGLTGAYPLIDKLQAGLSFEAAHDSMTGTQSVHSIQERSIKSELTPFVLYDRTRGSGLEMRGYRLSFNQTWNGSLLLQSVDSASETSQASFYLPDPWTHGRNSFAFHIQASQVRPLSNNPLFLDRRFFPGDEVVRGVGRRSLSPWVALPGDSDSSLQIAGADTVLGLSAEYRIPIRGPLSGAGFFDLGWTHLKPENAETFGTEAQLITQTNGLLRSSLGIELRFQLPVIQQPARLVFSWNPLRLDTLFSGPSPVLRLAEPRTTLRFALGGLY